ncbi:hypothetical protein NIES593_13130 [Hydrococcus rivularis NIES-593]|uniref:Uncharacterized protein n=1 Tax=Hydrococcus rivularis NIES-593 TaxID=1921803 RepID=A0A1U7HFV0_9CYAN|nr:hypothetical protein [Hydrococcus rivularis]OKH22408.1 hypothetical protein NIES593_13130 [Hydrococcus rivularis NIES-593]
MFDDLRSQFEGWLKSGIEQLGNNLQERFGVPEAEEPFQLIRRFDITDQLLTKRCISVDGDAWRIEAYDAQEENSAFASFLETSSTIEKPVRSVKLFEIDEPNVQECIIACRAWMKTDQMIEAVTLCLGFDRPMDFFGFKTSNLINYRTANVLGTEWKEYEVRYYFKKEQNPGKFKINLDFSSSGIAWIKDIWLLQAPVKAKN